MCLHNLVQIPEDRIRMETLSRVKPEVDPLFSVTFASSEHIGLQYIWLSCSVSQELKIYLVMFIVL